MTITMMIKCNSYFSPSVKVIASEIADDCRDLILHLNLHNPTLTSQPVIPFCELPITDILYKQDTTKKDRKRLISIC